MSTTTTTTTTILERPRPVSSSTSYAFNKTRPALPTRSYTTNATIQTRRPPITRNSSTQSGKGWYDTSNDPTLEDIAARLKTTLSRLEQYKGRCAQNVVMALMRPTPLVLFVFNPIALMMWAAILLWWLGIRS